MNYRTETRLWIAQRITAAILAVCVTVHLLTIIWAVRHGLTAGEIFTRVGASTGWLAFYALFVTAAAIHAPLGVRAVLDELTTLTAPIVNTLALIAAGLMLFTGLSTTLILYGQ